MTEQEDYSWLDDLSHRELKEMLISAWKSNKELRGSLGKVKK